MKAFIIEDKTEDSQGRNLSSNGKTREETFKLYSEKIAIGIDVWEEGKNNLKGLQL